MKTMMKKPTSTRRRLAAGSSQVKSIPTIRLFVLISISIGALGLLSRFYLPVALAAPASLPPSSEDQLEAAESLESADESALDPMSGYYNANNYNNYPVSGSAVGSAAGYDGYNGYNGYSGPPESAGSDADEDSEDQGEEDDEPAAAVSHQSTRPAPLRWASNSYNNKYNLYDQFEGGEPRGQDTNIAHAKIQLSHSDLASAAGHHHHHHHSVKGWLDMGAHTGKKGAFGWHDKHPVGGKGRR